MGHTLRLPDGFEFPNEVNGWHFDPEPYNGNARIAEDRETSVVVFNQLDTATVDVVDERVSGSENSVQLAASEYEQSDSGTDLWAAKREAAAAMVDHAVAWMRSTSPNEWAHPDVVEAVFDTPPGYELANYSRGMRETTVYYRRKGTDKRQRLAGAGKPETVTPETYPYLVVRTWHGSGNSDVALSPWRYDHDEERVPVVEPPAECGLDVALTMARQYAREHVDGAADAVATGQMDLLRFAEGE